MLQAFRGLVARPHAVPPSLKYCGSRFVATKRPPFDTDQNEDGFMLVGSGAEPSSLRPNLNDTSSTTSDDNWAQILQNIDPPSYDIMTGVRSTMRPLAHATPMPRRHRATDMEQRAMDAVFERVFNMDTSMARGSSVGNQFLLGSVPFQSRKSQQLLQQTEDIEQMFDQKREAMLNCRTDQELLQWAVAEVFQEPSANSPSSPSSTDTAAPTQPANDPLKVIHPGIYARVVAHLMTEFREKYNNPHLAIAIFDYTRRRSIVSFVTGCATPSFTELMRTYWNSFRDLQMVLNVAEEMRVNGVMPNDRTYTLYQQICEEADQQAARFEGGREEVMKMLDRLGKLTKPKPRKT